MAHTITFRSNRFDPSAEPPNPINPIAGHAVLVWLCESMREDGYACGTPDAEDWGWYVDVSGGGATYLIGASGEADAEADDESAGGAMGDATTSIEWTIQIDRHRSLTDKLFGRNAHAANDPLTALVERTLRASHGVTDLEVHRAR